MVKKILMFCCILTLVVPVSGVAQNKPSTDGTDYQFRLLFHGQAIEKDKKIGLAGWWAFPDMTTPKDNFKSLVIGGLLYKQKARWIEFMGGSLIHQNGPADPLANVRFSERGIKKVTIFGDLEYFFKQKSRRFYWWLGADTPVKLWKLNTRIGAESENINFVGKPDSYGFGPSLAILINKHVTFRTAYQFRTNQNFLRNYLVINF